MTNVSRPQIQTLETYLESDFQDDFSNNMFCYVFVFLQTQIFGGGVDDCFQYFFVKHVS